MSLIQLVYVSSATVPFAVEDLIVLLERSRRDNARGGVTGLLRYCEGNFMQALEGREEDVAEVQGRIARDPRHRGRVAPVVWPRHGLSADVASEYAGGF